MNEMSEDEYFEVEKILDSRIDEVRGFHYTSYLYIAMCLDCNLPCNDIM